MGGFMERAILVIVLVVALVGVVGLFSNADFSSDALTKGGITGNVVAGTSNYDCSACAGYAPVCGKLNHRYNTYENACEAACSGARIVREYSCELIN